MLTYTGADSTVLYQAGAGNETLDASGATGGMSILGGRDQAGVNSLVGGAGNDTFYAGSGADTMVAGGGSDKFVFYKSIIAGASVAPHDYVSGFNAATDMVYLAGYGSAAAATAIANAHSAGNATTLTLSDNTKITFAGISSASSLSGHITSFCVPPSGPIADMTPLPARICSGIGSGWPGSWAH